MLRDVFAAPTAPVHDARRVPAGGSTPLKRTDGRGEEGRARDAVKEQSFRWLEAWTHIVGLDCLLAVMKQAQRQK